MLSVYQIQKLGEIVDHAGQGGEKPLSPQHTQMQMQGDPKDCPK